MRHSVEKQSKQSSQHARKTLELRMEMKWENGHGNGKIQMRRSTVERVSSWIMGQY